MRLDIAGAGRTGCLVISSGGSPQDVRSVARLVPTEPGRLMVIMDELDPALTGELAKRLRGSVPKRWQSIRLVAAGAAAGWGDCPARELSDALDAEVLAPDGQLVLVPDGSLFVAGRAASGERGAGTPGGVDLPAPGGTGPPAAPDPGAWWRFRPGDPPTRVGRRYPTPAWEDDLAEFGDPGISGSVVEEIPCGLWLHLPARVRKSDLAFSVPMRADRVMLLVSRPGDPGLPAAHLGRLIKAIPEALYDGLIVVPYGDNPVIDGKLGAVAALAAGRPIRARTGLPLFVPDRGWQALAVGAKGKPTWRPFAREVLWQPDGVGRLRKWTPPADHLIPVGPGQFALDERWRVEVTESGLWVRRHNRADGAGLVRALPLDSRYCTVAVGTFGGPGREPVQPPWPAITKLLRKLPDDAGSRVRLAVPPTAGNWFAQAASWACRYVLSPGSVVVLTDDGTMEPWLVSTHRVNT